MLFLSILFSFGYSLLWSLQYTCCYVFILLSCSVFFYSFCSVLPCFIFCCVFFFFTQKTAYEVRISDWSSDVCSSDLDLDTFLPGLMLAPPVRVPGTAIFMTADPGVVPHALMHNLKHNKVLHERNVFLTVETLSTPYSAPGERLKME